MPAQQIREDEKWIGRCVDLARLGMGSVSPNPPVGAVLVYNNEIIGEGYHTGFGKAHAEVEAIKSVPEIFKGRILLSTLYVSLEPCCVHGKTPPCTDLIIQSGIPRVVIGSPDPNPLVSGNGVKILKQSGVEVISGVLEEECRNLLTAFRVNILEQRPYIILKWAQSRDLYYTLTGKRTQLSSSRALPFTHKLRAQADAIMCGARTICIDDPLLNTRYYPGKSPVPVIIDITNQLTGKEKIFKAPRVVYFSGKACEFKKVTVEPFIVPDQSDPIPFILRQLFTLDFGIVLVEGGAYLQNLVIQTQWDEAWVIKTNHILKEGVVAPSVMGRLIEKIDTGDEEIIGIRRAD